MCMTYIYRYFTRHVFMKWHKINSTFWQLLRSKHYTLCSFAGPVCQCAYRHIIILNYYWILKTSFRSRQGPHNCLLRWAPFWVNTITADKFIVRCSLQSKISTSYHPLAIVSLWNYQKTHASALCQSNQEGYNHSNYPSFLRLNGLNINNLELALELKYTAALLWDKFL